MFSIVLDAGAIIVIDGLVSKPVSRAVFQGQALTRGQYLQMRVPDLLIT